jgi:ABC-type multidrug transport system fused ATPase/permease subunit
MMPGAFLRWKKTEQLTVLGLGLIAAACEAGFILILRELVSGLDSSAGGSRNAAALFGMLISVVFIRTLAYALKVGKSVALAGAWTAQQRCRLFNLMANRNYPVYRNLSRFKKQTGKNLEIIKNGLLSGYACLFAGFQLICFFPLLLLFPWQLALTVILLLAPVALISRLRIAALRRHGGRQNEALGAMENALDYHMKRIEFYAGNGLLSRRNERLSADLATQEKFLDKWHVVQAVFPQFMETVFFLMIAGVSALLTVAGIMWHIRTEDMLPFLVLLLLLYKPVREWARQFPNTVPGVQAWREFQKTLELLDRAGPVNFMGSKNNRLQIRNLAFSYAGDTHVKPVFKDFSLELDSDDVTVISGANGAGKSTLLKLILGLESPLSGKILYPEAWINTHRLGVVYLPQDFHMERSLFIHLAGFISQRPGDWSHLCDILQLSFLDQNSLNQWEARTPAVSMGRGGFGGGEKLLSKGEIQRLGLAWAFTTSAPYLILDEPTVWLPSQERGEIIRRLFKFRNPFADPGRRAGALLVSHEKEITAMAHTALSLSPGDILQERRQ